MNDELKRRAQELADALDQIGVSTPHQAAAPAIQNAIDFLRQSALTAQPVAQPVCWVRTLDGEIDWSEDCLARNKPELQVDCYDPEDGYAAMPLYAAPQVAAPQGDEQPVAFRWKFKRADSEWKYSERQEWAKHCDETMEVQALYAHQGAQEPVAHWRPIDSAPRDGSKVLLAKIVGHPDHKTALWWATMGSWYAASQRWWDGVEPCGLADPTHWLPINAHGVAAAQSQEGR